ncbi:MAG: diguanylate cyclase [Bacillota bacterium]
MMREWEESRAEELSEYILVTQIICLLIFVMVIASLYNFRLGKDSSLNFFVNASSFIIVLLVSVYLIRKLILKIKARFLIRTGTDEMLLFVLIFSLTVGFLWHSKNLFNAKVLIMLPAIIAATTFGKNLGVGTAVVSGLFLFLADYLFYDLRGDIFQTDLIVSGVTTLSAWVVGGLIEIEKQTQRVLIRLADYDQLTGLHNHRYLQEKLALSLKEATAKRLPLSLILLDIDQFRYYNAVYGYNKGDEILAQIGKLLLKEVKEPDYAARYGSDEFALVLIGLNKEQASARAADLKGQIEALAAAILANNETSVKAFTVSTGVAGYPNDENSVLPLIRAAENDLFRAKYSKGKTYLYQSILSEISTLKIKEAFPTLQTLVALINAKDRYTFGHCERVLSYALALAERLGLSGEEKDNLRYGAYLHDIGKIEIDSPVLTKEGSLDYSEWETMKNHTVWGSEMIRSLPHFKEILPVIRSHHENYDGTGYPDGLSGEEIPLAARILRIADSFDAMTSDRPYRSALSFTEACLELKRNAGTLYDPELTPLFLEVVKDAYERERRVAAGSPDQEHLSGELKLSV